jgi:two-component system response regulator LytT
MPGLDGFGVIKKLLDRKVPLPKIVFATAFDQYAVKAFEVNAVDYILKPFDKKRVALSIEKARTTIEAGGGRKRSSRLWCGCWNRRSPPQRRPRKF